MAFPGDVLFVSGGAIRDVRTQQAPTPRNQRQETAISVQFVPGMRASHSNAEHDTSQKTLCEEPTLRHVKPGGRTDAFSSAHRIADAKDDRGDATAAEIGYASTSQRDTQCQHRAWHTECGERQRVPTM
eukprot:1642601-Rhodomonas_salina.2